ncbi:unnamed protein product [Trypanosoma congolense IL3000]|uniref:WGS project CAEQ00000000 data, annotated contig 1022 n=1 Tax=Trypanosoma congolense (strain IL3000) TaxID=1068625 RepID=F9W397_TRYCI|nr:unnamed protein product [Trypanosoma congolense IL3000]
MQERNDNRVIGNGSLSAASGAEGFELHGGLCDPYEGKVGEAAKLTADGVTKTNQTAASFSHAAIGRVCASCSVGHPKRSDSGNAAFVVATPQKPKHGRVLEKRQVHAGYQKAKGLKQMGERSCRTVAPLSEAASCDIKRRVVGYWPQSFTCTRSFIGMRRSNTKAEQHLAGTTDATTRET